MAASSPGVAPENREKLSQNLNTVVNLLPGVEHAEAEPQGGVQKLLFTPMARRVPLIAGWLEEQADPEDT